MYVGVDFHFDAGVLESAKAGAVHLRVGILHGGDYLLDAGGDDRVRARGRAALMRAGFQGQVERRAAGALAGFVERDYFGVFYAGPGVETAADDDVIAHDNGADSGIGADPA